MFNKLSCKHEYEYLDSVRDVFSIKDRDYASYRFVCSKCGKAYFVSQRQLERFLIMANNAQLKLESQSKPFDFESSKITLLTVSGNTHTYEGKYVGFILQYFEEQGIDLKQLPGNSGG